MSPLFRLPFALLSLYAATFFRPLPMPIIRNPPSKLCVTRPMNWFLNLAPLSFALVTKVMARVASADIMCWTKVCQRKIYWNDQGKAQSKRSRWVLWRRQLKSFSFLRKLSLGDARAYYLSTAKNELGVVSAQSAAGATMIPISWTEMQCPQTGQIKQRKVAKVK
ncbi:exosome complex component csl4-like isoform X1 [Amborella trichopoda]|uniref:exosome complex component csl4-like isoform X1 n=1 Tax=Amborella trichopoda TaxID=13333 RepID=UPI0009BE1BED|nr:exosome complex component csl4-like isoform X1 [Amborella trichopoda]|eukprot:XP_020527235.1 exosome complex component csl4-like isoform X1 [Amborella trichopoda]